eukprot:gnl/TRDRNA2_/TRDRNA2_87862_c0_seq2.p1 gnl/TRDRNA2_/TRDRNA2_87862_c0~~gnl/TRDRNA2_/TRDRNA2_87862_c0_seq2.p1  ORF type:complete len:140 (+),score=19.93 gnl/TRDRNA2_/TRDRNA2_87862_c0_seq2:77-496(+)
MASADDDDERERMQMLTAAFLTLFVLAWCFESILLVAAACVIAAACALAWMEGLFLRRVADILTGEQRRAKYPPGTAIGASPQSVLADRGLRVRRDMHRMPSGSSVFCQLGRSGSSTRAPRCAKALMGSKYRSLCEQYP